ncbi:MAG: anti-sigma factor [Anaerolineae bacterium]|nr:anti-sigma factor [Anaerolineae bacterium]
MERETLLDLIPAYALDALDTDERAAVESLLATDAEAQALLADYQEMTDLLVLAAPARVAPAHLTGDLRRRLAAERPSAPALTIIAATHPRSRPRWLITGLAAAAVLVIGLLAVLLRPAPADAPAQTLFTQLSTQADMRRIALTPGIVTDTVTGEMIASADGTLAVIRVERLPQIATDQTFQLWMVDANGPHSGGIVQFTSLEQDNYIALPLNGRSIDEFVSFGMSIEPQGGSPNPNGPTGPRVFGVRIA